MTLERYIGQTLQNSPDAARIMAEITGLQADSIEAGQKINPDLKLDVPVKRNSNNTEVELEFEQPLRPSDFGARQSHADAIRSTLSDEHKARLLDLSHEAVRAYVDLWTTQEQIALLDRLVKDAGRQTKIVQEAARQGLTDKAEAEILTTEAAEMKLQKSALEAKQKALLASFVRLAGLRYGDVKLEMPALPVLPDTASRLLAQTEDKTAIRALLEGRLAVAERRLSVAREDAVLPEFAPRALLRHDVTDGSNAALLGMRVTLPVWSRNEAERLRANAAYEEADRALKALDASDLPSVLASAWQAAVNARSVAEKYRNTVVPGWL
ncbi:MAG: TolC family protein, partial [Candidatus Micrarchaeaceae archaeon]